jgi:DNA repair protein RecO (recombination protein O)
MPLHTTEALVLRTYPLGETDRIVVLLTRDRGKKRAVARGARRSRRRFGGALEPLTRVRVAYREKENRELVALDYAEPLESPLASPGADAPGYAAYFAELIDAWAPQDHPNERLFRLGAAAVRALGAPVAVPVLARYFEYWLLRLEGVYPAIDRCAGCGRPFDAGGACLSAGGDALVCLVCAPRSEADLSPAAMAFLRDATCLSPDALQAVSLTAWAARDLERVHGTLLARHLDHEPRSLRVIREMEATPAVPARVADPRGAPPAGSGPPPAVTP